MRDMVNMGVPERVAMIVTGTKHGPCSTAITSSVRRICRRSPEERTRTGLSTARTLRGTFNEEGVTAVAVTP